MPSKRFNWSDIAGAGPDVQHLPGGETGAAQGITPEQYRQFLLQFGPQRGMEMAGNYLGSGNQQFTGLSPQTLNAQFGPQALAGDTRSLYALLASSPTFQLQQQQAGAIGNTLQQNLNRRLGAAFGGGGMSGIGAVNQAAAGSAANVLRLQQQSALWDPAMQGAGQNLSQRAGMYGQGQLQAQGIMGQQALQMQDWMARQGMQNQDIWRQIMQHNQDLWAYNRGIFEGPKKGLGETIGGVIGSALPVVGEYLSSKKKK